MSVSLVRPTANTSPKRTPAVANGEAPQCATLVFCPRKGDSGAGLLSVNDGALSYSGAQRVYARQDDVLAFEFNLFV